MEVVSEEFRCVDKDSLRLTQDIISAEEARNMVEGGTISLRMPTASVTLPGRLEAGKILGVDPDRPILFKGTEHETMMQPWQLPGVAQMIRMEQHDLGGGILADACGLGKTVQALGLIYLSPIVKGLTEFKPTLVIVPAGVIDTWVSEYIARFSHALTLYLLHASKTQTSDPRRKDLTVDPS